MGIDVIRNLVGQAPQGFEYIEYISAVCVSIFCIKSVIDMFYITIDFIKGVKK